MLRANLNIYIVQIPDRSVLLTFPGVSHIPVLLAQIIIKIKPRARLCPVCVKTIKIRTLSLQKYPTKVAKILGT